MTHPRKKIDTEQSALKSSQAYTPLVDQLANYWLHQGANVSAAEQISGAQLSALKQSSEGGHPGWSGNFMEVLRGEFKPHGKVGKSQRLMGKDQKGFEVSRKLRGKQFLATTSGMPVADVVDDPENCLCVGEFSMNGRAWKQLFGKKAITSEFPTHSAALEAFPASSHVHIAGHNVLMTLLTGPQLSFFQTLMKATFIENSCYVPCEFGSAPEAVPGNASFGRAVLKEIRRVKVGDCAVVQWIHHGLSVHSQSMERNAAMLAEITRTIQLAMDALDHESSGGLQTLGARTLERLWKTFSIKLRPGQKARVLGLCRQNRRFAWDDVYAAG